MGALWRARRGAAELAKRALSRVVHFRPVMEMNPWVPSTHPAVSGRAGELLLYSLAIGRVGHEALLWEVRPHDDAFQCRALGTLLGALFAAPPRAPTEAPRRVNGLRVLCLVPCLQGAAEIYNCHNRLVTQPTQILLVRAGYPQAWPWQGRT